MSTLGAVSSTVHSVVSSLDGGYCIQRLVFLDYADVFGCTPFRILQQNGTDLNASNALRDYFYRRTWFTCFGKNKIFSRYLRRFATDHYSIFISFPIYFYNLLITPRYASCKYAEDVVFGRRQC